MIAKLRGTIDTIGEDYLIIDVNGVGYLVFSSSKTLAKLQRGSVVSLYIETVVREDSISLFGFADVLEKEWFLTLCKVQGVGAKVCLAILSVLSPRDLSTAVATGDKALFSRANGVGPKLAARLVTELKGKVVTVPIADASLSDISTEDSALEDKEEVVKVLPTDDQNVEDAISALVNLGYQRADAYKSVYMILKDNPEANMSDLIKLSLKEFAKKDF